MAIVIASMGNRPEAAKILYGVIAIIFAIIMFLMVLMSIYTIKASIIEYQDTNSSGVQGFVDYIIHTPTFRDMVISTMSTYGLYLLSSIMHLDPWHVFTCVIQYMLMLPSFVNILMVYAFTNLHDVSWGTKGIDAASELGKVVATTNAKGEKVVTVELPADDKDGDIMWEEHRRSLMKEAAGLKDRKDGGGDTTTSDDYFKQFRTNTVLLWFISNGLLVYIFTNAEVVRAMFPNTTAANINPYLTFLFWSVAFLSFVRWLCSTIYLFGWWSEGLVDAGKRNPLKSVTGNKV
ncbi:Chitin synthase, class 2 [Cladochytrium tenue]|nr:Chitin synthase, class 2 [Cladochytrium tenue]